ncbi:MAG: SpoIIE family protein phosphatase [Alphaproteobacteria bacterium]|nr:SpoIIE family protein phosphatase [Alphaproteobacteria bacterium]
MADTDERLTACTILVVEDDRVNAEIIGQHLQHAGYQHIFFAKNGRIAIEMTLELRPDLVILDMVMPEMDGFEYCQKIRAMPAFAAMPILVQTGLERQDYKLRAFTMGASDYITKPVHGEELAARVRAHLLNKILFEEVSARERKMREELRAAQAMQERLMPSAEQLGTLQQQYTLDIAGHFESSSEMGGDYWGAHMLGKQRMALYMLDFSGHGTAAAINVFRIHTLMQELTAHANEPGDFVTLLNRHLHPLIERSQFATFFYGVIDIEANSLEYAAAAAPPVLMYRRKEQHPEWLQVDGIPLGVLSNASYETIVTAFGPGDVLVAFSDCMIETPGSNGEVICHNMIKDCTEGALSAPAANPAQNILQHSLEMFRAHSSAPLRDDLTMSVYYRK